MEYQGKLFGKIGDTYFYTGKTSEDWDKMVIDEKSIKELKSFGIRFSDVLKRILKFQSEFILNDGKDSRERATAVVDAENLLKEYSLSNLLEVKNEEPNGCIEEYDEDVCLGCVFLSSEEVPHPAGCSKNSVEKNSCSIGHWEDDF